MSLFSLGPRSQIICWKFKATWSKMSFWTDRNTRKFTWLGQVYIINYNFHVSLENPVCYLLCRYVANWFLIFRHLPCFYSKFILFKVLKSCVITEYCASLTLGLPRLKHLATAKSVLPEMGSWPSEQPLQCPNSVSCTHPGENHCSEGGCHNSCQWNMSFLRLYCEWE